ncbi:MAG: Hsp20/alpha crystallin family protein [Candidatus Velthaea sp.]
MALTNVERNGAGASSVLPRGPLTDWGFDPLQLFRNFSSGGVAGIEVNRTEQGFSVELPVPGYTPEQVDITYQDGALTISGRSERRSFTRSLVLPEDIDPDNTTAHVEHGMLTLSLARHPQAQPKKIKIGSGTA